MNLFSLEQAVRLGEATVTMFGYRKVALTGCAFLLENVQESDYSRAMRTLMNLAGKKPKFDNHVAFLILFQNGQRLAVSFSDGTISIGVDVQKAT